MNGQPYRSNGEHKNQYLGLGTKTIFFLFIACSHENQGHVLPWIVNTNVSTYFVVQNLVCLDCLHWFVVVVAIAFPVTILSNCNKCAEWFTDCVTDDTTNPTRKFPNSFGIGSSNDMRAPNNNLRQRTVDSASEVTWKIGPSLGVTVRLAKTVSNVSAKKWVKVTTLQLQLFRCDVGNRFEKSRIVNIRLAPKQLEKTKALLLVLGSSTHCFTCFVLIPFQLLSNKMSNCAICFLEWTMFFMKRLCSQVVVPVCQQNALIPRNIDCAYLRDTFCKNN